MRQRRLLFTEAILVIAVMLLFALSTFAKENPPLPGGSVETAASIEEESAGAVENVIRNPASERSPLILKLHEARRDGDHEAMRRLRALLPKKTASGESAGDTVRFPSQTVGGVGDYAVESMSGKQKGELSGPPEATFGGDVKIRPSNLDTKEWNHSMASDLEGNLYVVWQDNSFSYDYVQVYKSEDGGESWKAYGYVQNATAHLKEPSIAVGNGSGGDVLLLAYIVDDGVNMPVPEVATTPIPTNQFTIHSVPVWSWWEGYAKPVICTDSVHFTYWYAYLTCEGIFDSATDNINVCTWRSMDSGVTWEDDTVLFGNGDDYEWRDPDICYGTTTLERVFVVTHNRDDGNLYCVSSDDYAETWNAEIATHYLDEGPDYPVDPEIAAAVQDDNVMICCTHYHAANSDYRIKYTYSTDGGDNFGTLYLMYDNTDYPEFAVSLTANEGGGSWHLAYTSWYDQSVLYTSRPQDLSGLWETPVFVDDERMAYVKFPYTAKGIASGWHTDVGCVAWPDWRDPGGGDLDGYADYVGNLGLMVDETMILGATGGSVNFTLNAGKANAGRNYILLGSNTKTGPGITLPGGMATLPINFDIITMLTINLANTPVFTDFMSTLDKEGKATATMNVPPCIVGGCFILRFAFALNNPWDYASNPAAIFLKD